jgi:[acyl-carrier-protein] S-malonyltransferase
VITGEEAPLSKAVQSVKERGGKAIPLKVSGAWHSRLMEGAVVEFREFLEDVPFAEPKSGILFNATAASEKDPHLIRDIMAKQLVSPVKWYDIIQGMLDDGVTCFVEVGPKKVLAGLIRKILPKDYPIKIANVEDTESLTRCLQEID